MNKFYALYLQPQGNPVSYNISSLLRPYLLGYKRFSF